jgi:paraquat-inducible protein B
MSKQANKTVIGIFVVGAIALVVVAVVVLGSGKFFRKTNRAVCYFEGSVGGLNVGAPVVFRGVRIGSVTDVLLRLETAQLRFSIPVYIEIEPQKFEVIGTRTGQWEQNLKIFIDRGLSASLETQSIVTGQMQVALDLRPDKPGKFADLKVDTTTPEIPTVPTPMQELAKKIEKIPIDEIFEKLNSTLSSIDKLVSSPAIPEAIRSVNLALGDVRKLVQNVDNRVGPLVSSIEGTVNDYGKLARGADKKIDTLSVGLGDTIKEIQKTVSGIEKTLAEAESTLAEAKHTLSENSTLSYEITETLEELQKGARSIRLLSDDLKRHPESVIWGKGKSGGK